MFKTLVYSNNIYENFEVNEDGLIKNKKTDHIYKPSVSNHGGYLVVYLPLGKRGQVKCVRVHKAVAETFIPNPNNYPIVNHIDENKQNPRVDNLEWTTCKGNIQAHLKVCSKRTSYFNNRKLSMADVNTIKTFRPYFSINSLAKMFGVSKNTILNVLQGKTYCNGY